MSKIFLDIMVRAVKLRMEAGEELEAILDSYPKLTDEDKAEIREAIHG